MRRTRQGQALGGLLLLLAGLYCSWLTGGRQPAAVLAIFVAPPLLLGAASLLGWRLAGYWSSIAALGWFSHAVMRAWTDRPGALPAWTAMLLALAIIATASGPAARARLQQRRQARKN